MKKYKLITTAIVLALMVVLGGGVKSIYAIHYTLNPSSGTFNTCDNFSIMVGVDSSDKDMVAGDVVLNYKFPGFVDLEVVSVEKVEPSSSRAFPYSNDIKFNFDNNSGNMGVTIISDDNLLVTGGVKAKGNLFKINFKAKSQGTAKVSFDCTTGSLIDTNLLIFPDGSDAVVCSSNTTSSYTIGPCSSSTGGSTTTIVPTPTTTTTTTKGGELPRTGSVFTTIVLTIIGTLGVIGAFLLKI